VVKSESAPAPEKVVLGHKECETGKEWRTIRKEWKIDVLSWKKVKKTRRKRVES